jgi:hypothetical protein
LLTTACRPESIGENRRRLFVSRTLSDTGVAIENRIVAAVDEIQTAAMEVAQRHCRKKPRIETVSESFASKAQQRSDPSSEIDAPSNLENTPPRKAMTPPKSITSLWRARNGDIEEESTQVHAAPVDTDVNTVQLEADEIFPLVRLLKYVDYSFLFLLYSCKLGVLVMNPRMFNCAPSLS